MNEALLSHCWKSRNVDTVTLLDVAIVRDGRSHSAAKTWGGARTPTSSNRPA